MQIFTNNSTGIAVKIESDFGIGYTLTHVSFDEAYPEDGNTVIEVRKFSSIFEAEKYAAMCVSEVIPKNTYLGVWAPSA